MLAGGRAPGSAIAIATLPNLRDLGGWPTRGGGRVRVGLIYRSTALGRLSEADGGALVGLGLRSVYDLRTEAERETSPDRVPEGVDYVVADVLMDVAESRVARLLELFADPVAAREHFGDGNGLRRFAEGYRAFVTLQSACDAYRTLFADLSEERSRPVLFHCTTGKDRTGWAAAALLLLLGVPEDLVMREYLLTNEQLRPALQPMFDRFAEKGGDPSLIEPVLGVREEYLNEALHEMRQRFGTIDGYFEEGLGLDSAVRDALRHAFVESP